MATSVLATADSANGRVKVDVQGGVPGETLYLFRRDSGGVAVVRDTSGGDVVWPAAGATAYTGLMPNPDGTGGTAGLDSVTAGAGSVGPALGGFTTSLRHTRSATGAARHAARLGTVLTASTQFTVLVALRSNVALTGVQLSARPDTASGTGATNLGGAVSLAAGVVQVVEAVITTSATAVTAQAGIAAVWTTGAVSTTLDMVVQVVAGDASAQLSGPFSGAYSWDATYLPSWSGTPGASTSLLNAAAVLTVYDNEAKQGLQTDYILADANGVQLGVYRIDVPLWGTWLKSPGRPYLNTRCVFGSEAPVVRKARRASIDIEGAAQPIVLSEARSSRGGALTLAALTLAQAQAIDKLLDDGTTLMLDTPPSWGVAFRYISVGDSTSTRGLSDGQLGLERTERIFSLADVLHVDAPIGVTVVDPGRTYATLPVLYGNYAALAAINPDYEALALGTAD